MQAGFQLIVKGLTMLNCSSPATLEQVVCSVCCTMGKNRSCNPGGGWEYHQFWEASMQAQTHPGKKGAPRSAKIFLSQAGGAADEHHSPQEWLHSANARDEHDKVCFCSTSVTFEMCGQVPDRASSLVRPVTPCALFFFFFSLHTGLRLVPRHLFHWREPNDTTIFHLCISWWKKTKTESQPNKPQIFCFCF